MNVTLMVHILTSLIQTASFGGDFGPWTLSLTKYYQASNKHYQHIDLNFQSLVVSEGSNMVTIIGRGPLIRYCWYSGGVCYMNTASAEKMTARDVEKGI